jgi:polar amino acid transport system substrate-binding protein
MIRRHLVQAIFAGALALTSFAGSASAEALDDILAAKVIRIAVPTDSPPFGSIGSDMQPQGLDIDMARLIGKELGVRTELVAVSSANRIPYLQSKKVDLVISTLGKNPEREKVIDFSAAYAPFFMGVFGLKSVAVSKPEQLSGKTVGATRGALEEQELSKIAPADATIKRYEDFNATVAAYVSGQVDIIASGNALAGAIADRNAARAPDLKFIVKDSPCFIGLNKDEPKLLAKVNEIIAKARASGETEKMSQTWLKAPLPPGF